MIYLRSPSGDCFHCGEPYSLHDSCTDACANLAHPTPPLGDGAKLEGGCEPPFVLSYDHAVEVAIEANRQAFIHAPGREERLAWQGAFYTAMGRRRKPVADGMEQARMRRVGL